MIGELKSEDLLKIAIAGEYCNSPINLQSTIPQSSINPLISNLAIFNSHSHSHS